MYDFLKIFFIIYEGEDIKKYKLKALQTLSRIGG